MKKLLIYLTTTLLMFGSAFAYTPTAGDQGLVKAFSTKLDEVRKNDAPKFAKLEKLLPILLRQLKDDKSKFIFQSLIDHVAGKITQSEPQVTEAKTYKVVQVVDGDTVKINMDGSDVTIRMIGLDAPESNTSRYGYVECFGKSATDYLTTLLSNKSVSIEMDTTQGQTDKYGRMLAYVLLNGENINERMITDGYAWEYTYNLPYKYQQDFKDAQEDAESDDNGLWSSNACAGERKAIEEQPKNDPIEEDTGTYSCSAKKYCTEMVSCEEAKYYLNQCGLSKLDADKDGIPCESLCK